MDQDEGLYVNDAIAAKRNTTAVIEEEGQYLNDALIAKQNAAAVKDQVYHSEEGGNYVCMEEITYAGIQDSQQASSEHPAASLAKRNKQRLKIAVSVIAVALLVLLGLSIVGIILVSQEKLRLDNLQENYENDVKELRDQNRKLNESLLEIKAFQVSQNKITINATPGLTTEETPITATALGWTVFQRRQDGSVDFNRTWAEYVNGFGDKSGEFWMGLEKLHQLTSIGRYKLRIDLRDWEDNAVYAEYSDFSVGPESDNYRLTVSGYSGEAGDSLTYTSNQNLAHNGMEFSSRDNDRSNGTCAKLYQNGWWFNNCFSSNLNGIYHRGGKYNATYTDGIVWAPWKNDWFYSMKFAEMKLRPAQ